jgi:long-chain acyl-CoA synthetase
MAPDDNFYATRDFADGVWLPHWTFISRTTFCNRRNAVGSFLHSIGADTGSPIGILSYSRLEWVIIQYACYGYSYIPVPIYDTFGWPNVNYILAHTSLHICFVISTKVNELLNSLDQTTSLTDVIVIDVEEHPYDFETAPSTNIHLHKFADSQNFSPILPLKPPDPQFPAFIMYTSGSTNAPKGCVISHANVIASAAGIASYLFPFSPEDSMLSYLPLAHVMENVFHVAAVKIYGKIGFYSGSIPRLVEEFALFKPTIVVGVTRVFQRIQDGILGRLAQRSIFTRGFFWAGYYAKAFLVKHCRILKVPILDRLFGEISGGLGGKVHCYAAGGSYIPPDVQMFMTATTSAAFMQGYGLTETCSCCLAQRVGDLNMGNCGHPSPNAEVKLRSCDGYDVAQNCGELLVRGPSNFSGYFRNEEETSKILDVNGWLQTGDIFRLTPAGQLAMIGRRKELVKLAQGEYVSLDRLTRVYSTAESVRQIYLHAALEARFLVAVVVVDEGVSEGDVQRALDERAAAERLNGFERIGRVVVTTEEFTTVNGLMTPSLKLSGFAIERRYAKEIAAALR